MPTVSHWQADIAADFSPGSLPATCDVAIVGGGIAGVSTAYWLRRLAPDLDVVVVERQRLASGASGRNAGFLLQGTDADFARTADVRGEGTAWRLWQFTQENRDALAAALAATDAAVAPTGSLTVAGDAEEAKRLRRAADLLSARGVVATYLDADALNARIGSRDFTGALDVPAGAALHPVHVVQTLARQSGVGVVEGITVTGLQSDGNGVRVETDRGTATAGEVVLALNAYLPALVPALSAVVQPHRAQMLATGPQPFCLREPIYSHEGYFYLRQLPTGEVLLGGARHLHRDAEVGDRDETTDELQADLEAYLRTHFPDLAKGTVVRRWSGTMGFSADGLPATGVLPDMPKVRWVGGFTGHGMGYGFRMGRLVASGVLGISDPYVDLFDAARFDLAHFGASDSD